MVPFEGSPNRTFRRGDEFVSDVTATTLSSITGTSGNDSLVGAAACARSDGGSSGAQSASRPASSHRGTLFGENRKVSSD
jgi:hypothetical protein